LVIKFRFSSIVFHVVIMIGEFVPLFLIFSGELFLVDNFIKSSPFMILVQWYKDSLYLYLQHLFWE